MNIRDVRRADTNQGNGDYTGDGLAREKRRQEDPAD